MAQADTREPIAGPRSRTGPELWPRLIPWFTTIISVAILVALATFLIENLSWFRSTALATSDINRASYRVAVLQMHLAMVKRSVGLFSGFSLVFIGTSISFYTLRRDITLGGEGHGFSGKLATASPGIVAMVLGTCLIMFTIYSKDQFPAIDDAAFAPSPKGRAELAKQPRYSDNDTQNDGPAKDGR
jgi:hypothetical protein